ncbi:S8 family peptidase [Marinimicrococcus flavescens]|uniref:S8 family serine peptidase n=1 Tax=Marinimicrococcus flavescens TaxID=3031815 RepID=A0AAP3XSD1_9PROT|nr:S8 family serine peptidase [Marinimicrococcus flavescens]
MSNRMIAPALAAMLLAAVLPPPGARAAMIGTARTVAVIDTGADANHPALWGRLAEGSANVAGPAGIGDVAGHGTAVASIVARDDPDSRILVLRADTPDSCPARCSFREAELIRAIDHAIGQQADVINLSIQSSGRLSKRLKKALVRAVASGSVLVVAAGNGGAAQPAFPARWVAHKKLRQNAIVAGASTDHHALAGFSNRAGKTRDNYLLAPGVGIEAARPGGGTWLVSGTSFAAPQISAAVSRLLGEVPELTSREAVALLFATARDIGRAGPDRRTGHGELDIEAALAAAREGGWRVSVAAAPARLLLGPAFGDALATGTGGLEVSRAADETGLDGLIGVAPELALVPGPGGSLLFLGSGDERAGSPGAAPVPQVALLMPAGTATRLALAATGAPALLDEDPPGRAGQTLLTGEAGLFEDRGAARLGLARELGGGLEARLGLAGEGGTLAGGTADLVAAGRAGRFLLGIGLVDEDESFLGSRDDGGLGLDAGARSRFVRAAATLPLDGRTRLLARGVVARSEPRGGGGPMGAVVTSSFALAVERDGLLAPDDRFHAALAQPMRVESGVLELAGGRRAGLEPSGRELDLELAWSRPLAQDVRLAVNAIARTEPGHRAGVGPDLGGLVRLDLRF